MHSPRPASRCSASKAALLALSDALRLELRPFGVHVTYVAAGATKCAARACTARTAGHLQPQGSPACCARHPARAPTLPPLPSPANRRSSLAANSLAGGDLARYERPDSLYRPLAAMIR